MGAKYIALDGEFGGLDECHSLLTMYLVVLNEDLQPIKELYLYTKPDDGNYCVNAQAMAINKIDLIKHDAIALTYSDARKVIGQFLREMSDNGKIKLIPLGHNCDGDIRIIWRTIYGREKWNTYVAYRKVDTAGICQFLKDSGKLPVPVDGEGGVSGSLQSLANYFDVSYDEGGLHDAKVDTLLTIEVYKRMKNL